MSKSKIPHLLLSFSLFCLTLDLCLSSDSCDPNDQKILLRVKTYFGNPSSLASWDPKKTPDCGLWEGIGTDDHGHVIRLRVQEATDIRGPIPPFLDQLHFVKTLDFSRLPNLSGQIPSSIGKMTTLTQLFLSESNLTGPIPVAFGGLTQLALLDLNSNKLTGPIPSTLAQLTQLDYLRLSSNMLTGSIPDFLGRKLTKLNYIGLYSNRFSGPIPASLSLLPVLTTLHLSNNRLTGPIPNPLGRVDVMSSMDLSGNQITGDASFLFDKKYTALSFLYLNSNLLKFDFSNVDLTPTLVIFNISHNMIYGSLPKRFGQMKPDPNYVDVSYNQLCGPIPNGRRFKRADPKIFAQNKCLCGGPLPPCK